jgi:oligoendopeptidase F
MFEIEQALFAARAERQLSPAEITEIAVRGQRDLFGDALDPASDWRFLWIGVPHLYFPDLWYYNFPYQFGLLFGLGLFARYQAEPAGFPARFDALLADTGAAPARDLAARFGIDLHESAFWQAGLATITANFRQFEDLVDRGEVPRTHTS